MTALAFLPFGRFGQDVEHVLSASEHFEFHTVRPGEGGPPRPAPLAVVTAGSTPLAVVEAAVRAAGFGRQVLWLPLLLEPSEFSVGPWIGRGAACLECYDARRAQHDGSQGRSDTARAVWDAAAHAQLWPHLPSQARLAAGVAIERLFCLAGEGATASRDDLRSVVRWRSATGDLHNHRVLARGGCEHCAVPRPARSGDPLVTLVETLAKAG